MPSSAASDERNSGSRITSKSIGFYWDYHLISGKTVFMASRSFTYDPLEWIMKQVLLFSTIQLGKEVNKLGLGLAPFKKGKTKDN